MGSTIWYSIIFVHRRFLYDFFWWWTVVGHGNRAVFHNIHPYPMRLNIFNHIIWYELMILFPVGVCTWWLFMSNESVMKERQARHMNHMTMWEEGKYNEHMSSRKSGRRDKYISINTCRVVLDALNALCYIR